MRPEEGYCTGVKRVGLVLWDFFFFFFFFFGGTDQGGTVRHSERMKNGCEIVNVGKCGM